MVRIVAVVGVSSAMPFPWRRFVDTATMLILLLLLRLLVFDRRCRSLLRTEVTGERNRSALLVLVVLESLLKFALALAAFLELLADACERGADDALGRVDGAHIVLRPSPLLLPFPAQLLLLQLLLQRGHQLLVALYFLLTHPQLVARAPQLLLHTLQLLAVVPLEDGHGGPELLDEGMDRRGGSGG